MLSFTYNCGELLPLCHIPQLSQATASCICVYLHVPLLHIHPYSLAYDIFRIASFLLLVLSLHASLPSSIHLFLAIFSLHLSVPPTSSFHLACLFHSCILILPLPLLLFLLRSTLAFLLFLLSPSSSPCHSFPPSAVSFHVFAYFFFFHSILLFSCNFLPFSLSPELSFPI